MIRYSIIRVSVESDIFYKIFGESPKGKSFRLDELHLETKTLFGKLLNFKSLIVEIVSCYDDYSKRILVDIDLIFTDDEEALIYKIGWDHTILEEHINV